MRSSRIAVAKQRRRTPVRARQRKHWHYNEAHKLAKNCQVLAVEDLSIRNMKRRNKPKKRTSAVLGVSPMSDSFKKVDGVFVPNGQASSSGLNKSWNDNAVGNFLEILTQVSQKYGIRIVKVNPRGTSQHCSRCLNRVSKTLSDRWHECDNCGLSCDRDYNSALLIEKLASSGELRRCFATAVGSSRRSSQDKKLPSLKDLLS